MTYRVFLADGRVKVYLRRGERWLWFTNYHREIPESRGIADEHMREVGLVLR